MKLTTILAALMLAAAMAFAACGDDDDGGGGGGGGDQAEAPAGPAELTITANGRTLKAAQPTASGVTEITLQNDGKQEASAQLIKVEEGHADKEVVKIYNAVGEGGKIPDWILAAGGVGTTGPGQSSVVTQELEEGTYYAFNDELDRPTFVKFEVGGEPAEGDLPSGSTVTASEYKFETDGIAAGEPVVFENAGQQPHHLIAAPLNPGKTAADVVKFFKTDKGPPPIDFDAVTGTSVIDTDQTVVGDLELEPGEYALLCFISDREGGPPHAAQGMVSAATVE